jgi:hypothetical protein
MKRRSTLLAVTLAVAMVAPAFGFGIPAKTQAKKILGNLVPTFYPTGAGRGHGDDENDSPALIAAAAPRSACTFKQGKFKMLVGKDVQVQLTTVTCGGTPFSGTLCAHTKLVSTIMSDEIDKNNVATPVICPSTGGNIEGKMNFVTGNVGTISCAAGSCSGTLPVVTTDPCPAVDKVSEVRRVEVFDGPDLGSLTVLGSVLSACCGPGQTAAGPIGVSGVAPCTTSTQDVMGEMGTIVQGVAP